jgi:DNA-binding transcriptional LysR family regulator
MHIERSEARILSTVVEAGGFSRAAEKLGVSQSAVSQSVANLEHKLNTALLTRTTPPELTEAGIRLYRYSRMVLDEEHLALDDIAKIKSGALSTLSLAVNSTVNRCYAQKLLLDFCALNPLTCLKLDVAPSMELIKGVDADRWEMGFGPFLNDMPGHFVCQRFFTEKRYLIVHQQHEQIEALQSDPLRAVQELPLLTSYLDSSTKKKAGERLRDNFSSIWEVSNLGLRIELARAGMGVLYLSDLLLTDLEDFVVIEGLGFSTIERQVGLYFKKHKPLSEGAKRFRAICQAHFRD